jgi:hypothetical protein
MIYLSVNNAIEFTRAATAAARRAARAIFPDPDHGEPWF